MKRLLAVLLLVTIMLAMVGCNVATVETETKNKSDEAPTSMFVEVENGGNWTIVYHRETKVMYAISRGGHNNGTFTVLMDADGKPVLWEK